MFAAIDGQTDGTAFGAFQVAERIAGQKTEGDILCRSHLVLGGCVAAILAFVEFESWFHSRMF